ncbi:carboxy-S-adenosyl-L-methionine synthase CmoA [Dyadobacter sediminis]|uniref:Carboxy-S-adenosyl-L-methionine synthase n=1 Tax=Dyadobacter sediminis TaxID=1493691 RepID=A0A5R9KEV2_9BACT|nr:carboxy-S-adenosyl-L-methionine synthase CmoA [Dyadobacter sediminis]TLU94665.1 carboxy-S-adenosyl-L-methionine synthase CmoA [Dyadobacter sediminis]GGB89220.1 carboxy-S-adenosyl-L-methionine synthase [Dyadobacter sediminis]
MTNSPDFEQDEVFKDEITKVSDFKFGTTVVKVFDDMVSRSVPYYNEMQRMVGEIAADHVKEGSCLYDLGCSTGTTMIEVDKLIPSDIRFIGIDESPEMLAKCDVKLKEADFVRPYDLVTGDLHEPLPIQNASVVILCLTLQFVRPLYRERLLRNIYAGLNPGGVLILVEKVLAESTVFNRDFIKYYYNYKRRNHYSEMEISQKREALENVLIPYKLSENLLLLKEAGFGDCEIFFKWYNFSGLIAYKKS